MKKFFVSAICLCLSFSTLSVDLNALENTHLSGKLIKKHYPAPSIVKNAAFGWYLELDKASQDVLLKQFQLLSIENQRLFKELNINLQTVQCVDCDDDILMQIRSFEGASIAIDGKVASPCLSRKHLCFSITPDEIIAKAPVSNAKKSFLDKFDHLSKRFYIKNESSNKDGCEPLLQLPEGVSEKIITLTGKLILRLFPGPPEYISIENGDRADYCWMLQMDEKSFKIATTTGVLEPSSDLKSIMSCSNHNEVSLSLDEDMIDFCCDHESKDVVVQGYLFHAHTAHHHSPILMNVKKIRR